MDIFNEIVSMTYFQRAVLTGLIVGFLGSFYGIFVVQRRMSFLGDGLAHAAFGGVALGLLLQTEPMMIAIPSTVIISVLITLIKDKTNLEIDTSIGIFFALSMALGIVFLALKKDYTADVFSYLFGSILMVRMSDIWAALVLLVLTILLSLRFWKPWAYATFDSELARADKHNTKFDDYVLSILIALTIVLSIKLVGIVLVAAYLVIPAASAKLVTKRFFTMAIMAVVFGIFTSLIGLFVSIFFNLPSGAVIILIQSVMFFVAAASQIFNKR